MTVRLDVGRVLEQEPWIEDGACVGESPDLFFPHGAGQVDYAPAKAICATCPVRLQCLAYALRLHMDDGIWGGTSPKERRQIRRKRAHQRGDRGRA